MFDEIQYVCEYQCVKLQLECVYQHATACIIGVISTHPLLLVKTTWLKYTYRERQREEKDGENMSGAYPQMYEIRSTASGVRVWVLQARSCFWAYVGLPVWNRVPVSHPPSHLLSLPLSPSLSLCIFLSLSLFASVVHCVATITMPVVTPHWANCSAEMTRSHGQTHMLKNDRHSL